MQKIASEPTAEMLEAIKDLVEILEREDIEYTTDEGVRGESSRDASIFMMTPQIVIYPRNSGDISTVVRNIHAPLSVTPRAGGTCMTGSPLTDSVSINLTKHMAYIEVNPAEQKAIVEMGAMYRDIEHKTLEHGMYLASYTSSKDMCGIGGMIGNNASGEKSIRYGATIDNVTSLKAILHDGVEYEFGPLTEDEFLAKTKLQSVEGDTYKAVQKELEAHTDEIASLQSKHPVKKSAGGYRIDRVYSPKNKTYSLAPLFIGSQSTLGIVTEAELHLTKKLACKKLIFMGIRTLSELPYVLKTVLAHDPESVETFDINTLERARGFYPEHANVVDEVLKNPSTGGAGPKAGSNAYSLFVLAEFTSNDEGTVGVQAADVSAALKDAHGVSVSVIDDEKTYESLWRIRRTAYGVFRDYKDGSMHAVPCIEDVIVPVSKFDIFIPELIKILEEQKVFYGFHGHIGDGALRIIPVFDLADPKVAEQIDALCRKVFALVKELGGNMSADHSDGIIRTPYLREFYGDAVYSIFERIKKAFDPEGIFNPKKKVGGTFDDIRKHMIEV